MTNKPKRNIFLLKELSSMSEALNYIDFLSDEYNKTFKKREKVALTVATVPGVVRGKEYFEVRCHFTDEERLQADWFVKRVSQ